MGRIKQVIAFMLTLILIITLPSISTYAKIDANATGGGSGNTGSTSAGGASQYKYGYRMYIVNSEGKIVSPVVDMVSDVVAAKACNKPVFTTRIGNGTAKRVIQIPKEVDIPQPFKHNDHAFVGNGTDVRDWAMKKNKAGKQNIMALIHKVFDTREDTKYVDMFSPTKSDGSYSLILEPVTWHDIYYSWHDTDKTGDSGYGTFYNWMKIYRDYNKDGLRIGKSTYTSSLDQNVLGNCMVLEKDQLGLSKPTTKPTNHTLTALSNKGYGIHIYSNNAKKETPYTVITGYVTWYGDGDISNYADGGKVETDDIVKNSNVAPTVKVEDYIRGTVSYNSSTGVTAGRQGYELMSWVVTDAKKNDKKLIPKATNNGVVTWYTTIAGESQEAGAKGGVVKLNEKKGKRTLYILYVRRGKEELDIQTTCDEDIPDKKPHKAPDESDGAYTIVKNYVTNTDGKYTDDGCYIKKETGYNVRIEDEEDVTGYKLVNWAVTEAPSKITSINPVDSSKKLVWDSKIPKKKLETGKKEATVDVKKLKGKVVYVLLEREKTKQTTCDEGIPDKKPHKAPDESKGKCTIVKNYVTNTGRKYTNDGCYIKKETSYNVKIEDEKSITGYKLVNWAAWVYRRWQGVLAPCLFFNFFIAIIKIVCGV